MLSTGWNWTDGWFFFDFDIIILLWNHSGQTAATFSIGWHIVLVKRDKLPYN